jgi:hypothetical protein
MSLFAIALRRIRTGHPEFKFSANDLSGAFEVCKILVNSAKYNHCYAVASDENGRTGFTVYPDNQQTPAPERSSLPAPPPPVVPVSISTREVPKPPSFPSAPKAPALPPKAPDAKLAAAFSDIFAIIRS